MSMKMMVSITLVLAGCAETPTPSGLEDDVARLTADLTTLQDEVEALKAENATLRSDLDAANSALTTAQSDITAAQADVTDLQSDADDVDDQLSGLDSRLVTAEGDLMTVSAGLDDVTNRLEAEWIEEDEVWTIGETESDYVTIESALEAAMGVRIMPNGSLTLQVANGAYMLTGELLFQHPDGARISLVGNPSSPASVVLQAAADQNGITISEGHRLGLIDGFQLFGDGAGNGLLVERRGMVTAQNLNIQNFGQACVQANWQSYVFLHGSTVNLTGCRVGVWSLSGSMVYAPGVTVSSMSDTGLTALYSSFLNAQGATVSSVGGTGIEAQQGSMVIARDAEVSSAGGAGIASAWSSHVNAGGSATETTVGSGFQSAWSSSMQAGVTDVSGSVSESYYIYFSASMDRSGLTGDSDFLTEDSSFVR